MATTQRYHMDEDHCHTPMDDATPMVGDRVLTLEHELEAQRAVRATAIVAPPRAGAEERAEAEAKEQRAARIAKIEQDLASGTMGDYATKRAKISLDALLQAS